MPFSLKNQGRGQRQYRLRAHSLTGRSGLRRHTGEEKLALNWEARARFVRDLSIGVTLTWIEWGILAEPEQPQHNGFSYRPMRNARKHSIKMAIITNSPPRSPIKYADADRASKP